MTIIASVLITLICYPQRHRRRHYRYHSRQQAGDFRHCHHYHHHCNDLIIIASILITLICYPQRHRRCYYRYHSRQQAGNFRHCHHHCNDSYSLYFNDTDLQSTTSSSPSLPLPLKAADRGLSSLSLLSSSL